MIVKLGLVQMDAVYANPEANLTRIASFVEAATSQGAGIVVLPEMVTTGYFVAEVMDKVAEPIPGPTTARLGEIAKVNGVYIVCGMLEQGTREFYNSAVLMSPTGSLVGSYRKVHLWADDNKYYAPGQELGLFDTELGTVALTICYDLMFPEYIRALVLNGARIILNSTDWITPESRIDMMGWNGRITSALASARAIENRVVVAMANRVGVEGGCTSLGYSCICNQTGAVVALVEQGEGIATATVDLDLHGTTKRLTERKAKLAYYQRWEAQAEDE